MTAGSSLQRQRGTRGFALAATAALCSLVVGSAVALSPFFALALAVLAAAAFIVVLAFREPRWVLIITLFTAVGYVFGVLALHMSVPLIAEPYTLPAVVAAAVLYRRLLRIEAPPLPTVEAALLTALAVAMAVSAYLSSEPTRGVEQLKAFAASALLVILIVTLIDDAVWLRRAVWMVALVVGALACLTVFQQVTKAYSSTFGGFAEATLQPGENIYRSAGPLNPNYFGEVLVFAAIIALYLYLISRGNWARAAALATSGACLLAVGFTFSRGSLITAVVVLAVVAVFQRRRSWVPAGIVALVLVAVVIYMPPEAKTRLLASVSLVSGGGNVTESASRTQDSAVKGRVSENLAAFRMFLDNPVVGVGPGNFPVHYTDYSQEIGLDSREERKPHNLYLEALAETGFGGTLILVAIFATAFTGVWRARKELPENEALLAEGLFVGLIVFFVNGWFVHASAYPAYPWIAVGLAFAAHRIAAGERVLAIRRPPVVLSPP